MLSSGLRKVINVLLTLLAVAWITTDASATQLLRSRLARLDPKRVIERSESAIDAVRTQRPGKDIQVWFRDDVRISEKGRNSDCWWSQGRACAGASPTRD
jgi:hypothetical protein